MTRTLEMISPRPGVIDEENQVLCASTLPLVEVLRQVSSVVQTLSDEEYVARPVGVIDSSVGGHVRHCLDHVTAFMAALRSGRLDYDHRARGTSIESSSSAALEHLRVLTNELLVLDEIPIDLPLRLSLLVSPQRPAVEVGSTAGREFAFVLSHTIHHNALMGAMLKMLGKCPPADFGYAPSTLAHRNSKSCAPSR